MLLNFVRRYNAGTGSFTLSALFYLVVCFKPTNLSIDGRAPIVMWLSSEIDLSAEQQSKLNGIKNGTLWMQMTIVLENRNKKKTIKIQITHTYKTYNKN